MTKSYLEISLKIDDQDRPNAAAIYQKYKTPFLETISGALTKELLLREQDVQVLHGFKTTEVAEKYLTTALFNNDIVTALRPYLKEAPDVRIYSTLS